MSQGGIGCGDTSFFECFIPDAARVVTTRENNSQNATESIMRVSLPLTGSVKKHISHSFFVGGAVRESKNAYTS